MVEGGQGPGENAPKMKPRPRIAHVAPEERSSSAGSRAVEPRPRPPQVRESHDGVLGCLHRRDWRFSLEEGLPSYYSGLPSERHKPAVSE